jgi:hypothetical protein
MTDDYRAKLAEYHGITDGQMGLIWDALATMREREWTPITYVEIGVLYGGVFRRALEKLRGIHDFAYGVDLFEDFETVATEDNTHAGNVCKLIELQRALHERGLFNFNLKKGDSAEVVPTLGRFPYGIVVIDGNHTYDATLVDFKNAFRLIEKGFIFFHDTDWEGPDRVTQEIVERRYRLIKTGEVRGARVYEKG